MSRIATLVCFKVDQSGLYIQENTLLYCKADIRSIKHKIYANEKREATTDGATLYLWWHCGEGARGMGLTGCTAGAEEREGVNSTLTFPTHPLWLSRPPVVVPCI